MRFTGAEPVQGDKMRTAVTAIIILSMAGLGYAQPSADSRPASTNIEGAQYPRVHNDLRATFQVKAPDAQKIQVVIAETPYDMSKAQDGTWSVTVPPQVPGFHFYWLLVDGVQVCDPSSETFFGYSRVLSGIEIPEKGVDYYEVKDVPHGEIRSFRYFSKVTGAWRRANVYTPPDYDTNLKARYPVLLLQHGGGEDERDWATQGRADNILDNLIAAKKAVPMIVVMDSSSTARRPGEPAPPSPNAPGGALAGGVMNLGAARGGAANPAAQPPRVEISPVFGEMVAKDLLPAIDAHYRTIPDREHRAVAGLSLGAAFALQVGLSNLDKFSSIASFSGTVMGSVDPKTSYNGAMSNAAEFNRQIKPFFIAAGTAETSRHDAAQHAMKAFDEVGIKYVWFESPGTAHEWLTWRRDLNQYAQLLFK
jgi:enterochelin esterase-like enzyme